MEPAPIKHKTVTSFLFFQFENLLQHIKHIRKQLRELIFYTIRSIEKETCLHSEANVDKKKNYKKSKIFLNNYTLKLRHMYRYLHNATVLHFQTKENLEARLYIALRRQKCLKHNNQNNDKIFSKE